MSRLAAAAATLALLVPTAADASPHSRCIAASMSGQTHMLKGELHAARADLMACSQTACPRIIRHDCIDFLGKVATSMPTIVIGAHDRSGADLVDVRVSLDGTLISSHLDGKPVEVDPGSHTLHFEMDGAPPVDEPIVAHEGEKDRLVTATLGQPPPPPVRTQTILHTTPPSPWTWVVGGVGLATLAGTLVTGSVSLAQWQSLHDGCAVTHSCAPGDVAAVNTLYNVAYVTAAIGGALVLASIVMYFTTRHTHLETVVARTLATPGGMLTFRF